MAIFASDAQEMRVKLAALKKAVNEKRAAEGMSSITIDHIILELVNAAFDTASKGRGLGIFICNVFVRL
ncbi:hypothetical protein [Pantoea agglomerans]|uniref:hypothetical protein n=1 Tax=Enterobacter agglomerans TaxID=549 RepID=UPI003208993E